MRVCRGLVSKEKGSNPYVYSGLYRVVKVGLTGGCCFPVTPRVAAWLFLACVHLFVRGCCAMFCGVLCWVGQSINRGTWHLLWFTSAVKVGALWVQKHYFTHGMWHACQPGDRQERPQAVHVPAAGMYVFMDAHRLHTCLHSCKCIHMLHTHTFCTQAYQEKDDNGHKLCKFLLRGIPGEFVVTEVSKSAGCCFCLH